MALEIRQTVGLLAACVSVRDRNNGSIDSLLCASVLQAVEYAIKAVGDRDDKTAVVVVGEDENAAAVELTLTERSAGLARGLDQPGLFLTLAAQDIVRDRLLNDVRFEDFGIHGIDDSGRAERLFAVIHPDLPEPALPHKKVAGNCPRLHKSFVGRHRERDELQDLILQRSLVTIIGPPGVGKSTTAIHVARSFNDEYEDGTWWFSVDDRTSLDELLQAIANARGLLSLRGPLTIERIAEGLRDKRCIIVLDGCESMAAEIGAFCSAVIAQSNTLTLLLTSTRPLGIANEHVYRLNPMTLPRPTDTGEDALIGSEALSLFFERATQAGVRLALDDKNIRLASEICERVDGLPVAIELVAASLRTSSLQKLSRELTQDLGPDFKRSVGLSKNSLEKALKLSYATLSSEQHELLQRLAIFRSEWKTDVAHQLWQDRFDQETIVRLHQALVDGSWLAYDPDRDAYRMLHTVRSFSWERVGARSTELLSNFCVGMAEVATKVCSELHGATAFEAEILLSRHYSDFVFALETSLERQMTQCSSTLMKNMVRFWLARNLLEDAERLSLAHLNSGVSGIEAARALVMLGVVHLRRRKLAEAADAFERCLALTRELGDKVAEAATLTNLGLAMMDWGDYLRARGYYTEVLAMLRGSSQLNQLAGALCNSADVEMRLAEREKQAAKRQAYLVLAQSYLEEAKLHSRHLNPMILQAVWNGFGMLEFTRGQLDLAEANFSKAIATCANHKLRHEAGEATEALAEINLLRGLAPTAAKLLGLSRQIRKESGKTRTEPEMERFGRLVSGIYEQVDPDRAEKLMRYGERLDLAEILTPTVFNV